MTHRGLSAPPFAAHTSAERGWQIFPLVPGDKRPAVSRWEERATADRARIARCWAAGAYNIGVACGPSRLVVIDLDTPKNPDDRPPADWAHQGVNDGLDAFALLCEQSNEPLPADTFTVRTGRGGQHLYFAAPADVELRNTSGKLGWKIDTRAAGGYVVGPGSVVRGKPYVVAYDAEPAPLPGWLLTLLTPPLLPPQRPVMVPVRGDDRHSRYVTAAVNAELARVANSAPDEHNQDLYRAAVALGQLVAGGELTESEVIERLTEVAAGVGQRPREIPKTIASGLRAGARRPRTVGVAA
ncbi:bifunctional DNA primase/polymerase [Streptomyces sp. DSM 44915]|uniref:Bifunctional DNA primase/polymerase n=1 Tax=Streptomyces chisholmiae TaxID=3075540 RepID=A0ABU2JYE4_9ACTN|nr:bifunctional DNA primase/polymerase [Streptomyces sp. DSM 44915]MDT0270026.1 bifunctional DNA primase/polymerase [Streptomyces sp. DSM 44915]